MQYFIIFGNIVSIAAFVGFVMQLVGAEPSAILRYVLFGTTIATLGFWFYFYLLPKNKVSTTIKDRLNYSGRYLDSKQRQVDVYEGQFEATSFSPIEVAIPPFESAPEVTVFRKDGRSSRDLPTVSETTGDVIRFSVVSTDAFGSYGFRARGKTLSPVKANA